jgi:hypothetical protein
MAEHVQFTVDSGVQVYFCDPRSPWQRGTNQNTNRLLRQYLAKSADLRQLDQACYRRRAQRPPSTNPCLQDTLTSTRRGVALTPETASVSATAASPLGTYGIGRAATRSTLPPATAAVTTSRVRSTAARDALEWPRWRRIPTQSAQVGLANSLANAVAGSGPRGRSVAGPGLSWWFVVELPPESNRRPHPYHRCAGSSHCRAAPHVTTQPAQARDAAEGRSWGDARLRVAQFLARLLWYGCGDLRAAAQAVLREHGQG